MAKNDLAYLNSRIASRATIAQVRAIEISRGAVKAVDVAFRKWFKTFMDMPKGRSHEWYQVAAEKRLAKLPPLIEKVIREQLLRAAYWGWDEGYQIFVDTLPGPYWQVQAYLNKKKMRGKRQRRQLREGVSFAGAGDAKKYSFYRPPSTKLVNGVIHSPPVHAKDGKNWEERLDRLSRRTLNKNAISNSLASDLVKGKNPRAAAKRILPHMNGYKAGAERVARTEMLRVSHDMQRMNWKGFEDVISGFRILATLDDRTRPHHAARHGDYYADADEKGNLPENAVGSTSERPIVPDEPNCRCHESPVVRGLGGWAEDILSKDRVYASMGGPVEDPGTFAGWFDNLEAGQQKKIVGPQRYALVGKKLPQQEKPLWADFLNPQDGMIVPMRVVKGQSQKQMLARRQLNLNRIEKQSAVHNREMVELASTESPTPIQLPSEAPPVLQSVRAQFLADVQPRGAFGIGQEFQFAGTAARLPAAPAAAKVAFNLNKFRSSPSAFLKWLSEVELGDLNKALKTKNLEPWERGLMVSAKSDIIKSLSTAQRRAHLDEVYENLYGTAPPSRGIPSAPTPPPVQAAVGPQAKILDRKQKVIGALREEGFNTRQIDDYIESAEDAEGVGYFIRMGSLDDYVADMHIFIDEIDDAIPQPIRPIYRRKKKPPKKRTPTVTEDPHVRILKKEFRAEMSGKGWSKHDIEGFLATIEEDPDGNEWWMKFVDRHSGVEGAVKEVGEVFEAYAGDMGLKKFVVVNATGDKRLLSALPEIEQDVVVGMAHDMKLAIRNKNEWQNFIFDIEEMPDNWLKAMGELVNEDWQHEVLNILIDKRGGAADELMLLRRREVKEAARVHGKKVGRATDRGRAFDTPVDDYLGPPGEPGINVSEVYSLEDGTKILFKPVDGEMGMIRETIEGGTYARREVAASRVAKLVGMDDIVAETEFANVAQRHGAAVRWVDDATFAVEAEGSKAFASTLEDRKRGAIFDWILGNTDRHNGNYLLIGKGTANPRLLLIDHGLILPVGKGDELVQFLTTRMPKTRAEGFKRVPIPKAEVRKWVDNWDEIKFTLESLDIEWQAIQDAEKRLKQLLDMSTFDDITKEIVKIRDAAWGGDLSGEAGFFGG